LAPAFISKREIYFLDNNLLFAGSKWRGDVEDRIRLVIEEAMQDANIILVIDEIDSIMGVGMPTEGACSVDMSLILKPPLESGELQCIAITTIENYRKQLEKQKIFQRRFQQVKISEPTVEHTIEILNGIKPKYEKHHGVIITSEAINSAATLSQQFITDRFLPESN
jgi:ATP-dependent Clp protease ATP-binding subunit ClpC